jgi:choline dehydrogenase-like flavoprotein
MPETPEQLYERVAGGLNVSPVVAILEPREHQFNGAVFSMKPFSIGRVTLSSPDPDAPPLVDHGFLADERDVATLVRGLELVRNLAATEPLVEVGAGTGRGHVLGVENLVVADASIMPTVPRANTNLTTVAVAERIADLL